MTPGRLARITVATAALALLGQTAAPPPEPQAETPRPAAKPAATASRPLAQVTPMAQRVATLAVLNKQNGITRDIRMRPGQAIRLGGIIIRLRACEATPNWQEPPLTGAFIQVDASDAKGVFRRVFSGWTYAETPSLNPVAHPVYDVWVKSCAIRFPEIGPDTLVQSAPRASAPKPGESSAAASDGESSAPKSAEPATASDSND